MHTSPDDGDLGFKAIAKERKQEVVWVVEDCQKMFAKKQLTTPAQKHVADLIVKTAVTMPFHRLLSVTLITAKVKQMDSIMIETMGMCSIFQVSHFMTIRS
jgi:hypothetical protein